MAKTITAEVPVDDLQKGGNNVTVFLPGGTESPLDAINLESVALHVPVATKAQDNRILISDYETGTNVTADGFLEYGRAGLGHGTAPSCWPYRPKWAVAA